MTGQEIVEFAMRCGASWAGVEKIALTTRMGVACSFPSEFDAENFQVYARDFIGNKITREQEFVLVWL